MSIYSVDFVMQHHDAPKLRAPVRGPVIDVSSPASCSSGPHQLISTILQGQRAIMVRPLLPSQYDICYDADGESDCDSDSSRSFEFTAASKSGHSGSYSSVSSLAATSKTSRTTPSSSPPCSLILDRSTSYPFYADGEAQDVRPTTPLPVVISPPIVAAEQHADKTVVQAPGFPQPDLEWLREVIRSVPSRTSWLVLQRLPQPPPRLQSSQPSGRSAVSTLIQRKGWWSGWRKIMAVWCLWTLRHLARTSAL